MGGVGGNQPPSSGGAKLTPEGGFAIWVINDTGGVSVKGHIVEPSSAVDNGVQLTTDDDFDPVGIIYESGIDDGDGMWVIVSGIADVLYGTTVTRATFSRVPVTADGLNPGEAINEPLPSPPLATDKHFREIGHPIESRGTPGLAKTILHFN